MKKIGRVISLLALSFTLCMGVGLASCGEDSGSAPDSSESSVVVSITLNKTALTLDLEETVSLLAETQGLTGDIVWSSSDTAVATVEAGVVKAVGEGSAVITAQCGGYSATCSVEVSVGGKMPVLKINGDNADVKLMLGTDFTVLPALLYNGQTVDGVTYSYTVEDEGVLSVDENGRFTGKKAGTTTVQVQASWKSFTVYETITVEYITESYLQANKSSVTLYTSGIFGDKTTDTMTYTVVVDSQEVQNPVVTYEYDESALSIVGDEISVLKKENATYTVRVSYGDMSTSFTVETVYPIKNMEAEYHSYDFEAMGENLPNAFDCFTDGSSVVGVYDTAEPEVNLVQEGKLCLDSKYYGERSWVVHSSDGYAYQVKGSVVTKIITTAQQFQEIFMTKAWTPGDGWSTNATETYYDGYYVLGNDIEFSSPTFNDCKYKAYDVSGSGGVPVGAGFNGVFDGRGHTVSNIWIYSTVANGNKSNGIFGTIGENGVVKNVSFINGGGCNWVHCFLANSIAGTVDNVFLQMDLASYSSFFSSNAGVLAYRVLPTAKISNVVTYLSGTPYSSAVAYSASVSSFATRLDAGATLKNNYTVVAENGIVSGGVTVENIAEKYPATQLKAYTKAQLDDVQVDRDGFVAEYWELSDNLLPVMKSSLTLSQPRMSMASNYALAGAEVEISLNCFEHRYLDIVASAGSVSDGGNGEGQQDKKYLLSLTDVANQVVTVELKAMGRTLQTIELAVGGTGNETEVSLNKSANYARTSWNATSKTWTENQSDLVIEGLTALQGKTVGIAYVVNGLTEETNTVSVTLSGTTATVRSADLAKLPAGEMKLYLVSGNEKFSLDLSVVTAELKTEEQFVSIFLASEWHGLGWKYDANNAQELAEMTYEGYYVLGNDINFSNTYYVNKYRTWGVNAVAIPEGVGFNGIFDGKGYTINNLGITNFDSYNRVGGIFGTVGTKGVIRNVAFTNGRMAGSSSAGVAGYLANGIAGTVKDVFVHIDLTKSTINNAGDINVFAYGLGPQTKYENCVAYVSGSTSQNGMSKVRMSNCGHGVVADNIVNTYLITNDALTVNGLYYAKSYNETAVKNGTANITTTSFSSAWDLTTYKIPVFTTAKAYIDFTQLKK